MLDSMLKETKDGYEITRFGKPYTVNQIAEELNLTQAAILKRVRRCAEGDITLEQLFSPRVSRPVHCPVSGQTLLGVDPFAMTGQMYLELARLTDCGRAHYANGMCKVCYYAANPETYTRKAAYETTEAGRQRRQRNNSKPKTKAIKLLSTRKIRLTESINPGDLQKELALVQRLQREAADRFKVTEAEAKEIAEKAIEYYRKKNPD